MTEKITLNIKHFCVLSQVLKKQCVSSNIFLIEEEEQRIRFTLMSIWFIFSLWLFVIESVNDIFSVSCGYLFFS